MARSIILALAVATIASAQSTCPDGQSAAQVNYTPICCPGDIAVTDNGAGPTISCSIGCGPLTRTICDSSTTAASAATTVSISTTGLPSGCSTTVDDSMTTGVCTGYAWSDPNYLSHIYGSQAGTATFGASPTQASHNQTAPTQQTLTQASPTPTPQAKTSTSKGIAAHISEAPRGLVYAGAMAGLALL